jgi:tRNA 2-selenouridine synthase
MPANAASSTSPMHLRISVASTAIIDVRSESEYADDHIPGAINCPVLSDTERTRKWARMDRQHSSFEARRRGAALVSRNIALHLEQRFADRSREAWKPLVYCWRGGNRSESMTHVLARDRLACPATVRAAIVLFVGAKSSRNSKHCPNAIRVQGDLRHHRQRQEPPCCSNLGGLRRAGARSRGACAHHRGSVLGQPCRRSPQPTQKSFETLPMAETQRASTRPARST